MGIPRVFQKSGAKFSLALAVHKSPIMENSMTVYRISLIKIARVGRTMRRFHLVGASCAGSNLPRKF